MSGPVYQWQPTTRQIAARAGIDPAEVIRFDQNTSSRSPAWVPEVAASVAAGIHEYPAADYFPLRRAVAAYTGVETEQVVPGAGADELILLAARTFLPFGGTALTASPTYSLYTVATAQQEAKLIDVPRVGPGFEPALDEMAAAARRADLVWLCVPNNPTGLRDADDAIERVIAATAGIAVIDGAYAEFTGERWAPWLERHPNLVVLGTLSKAFAVAGARVGYSLSSPELAAELHRRRPPGSLSSLSAAIGERALADPAWAQANVAAVSAERERLAAELETRGFRTVPSVTNFILAEYGRGALDLAERLMWEDGLVVRTYATSPTLNLYLRFTVRSPAENDRLLAALDRRLP